MLLSPGFPPARGGIERTAGELAVELCDDCDVEVVAGTPPHDGSAGMSGPAGRDGRGGDGHGGDGPDGVRVHWTANDPPGGRRATAALLRKAIAVGARFRPEAVIAMHIRTMPAARALDHLVRSRTLLVIHAKEVREQPELSRAAVRWADATVTVSGFSRELALESGALPERLHTINPGVTIPVHPMPAVDARSGPPTIVTVSRMDDRHKGHREALAAMRLLRQRIDDVRWVMIGDGALRPELQAEATRLGLGDRVLFTGAVSDEALSQWLSEAHVFCMLSQEPPPGAAGEGFGIVLVEAGAHRLPVVAGRVPGVVDAVNDGVTGLLVDPGDAGQAAAALERLLTDPGLSRSCGGAGLLQAQGLTWPAVAARYRRLLDELAVAPSHSQSSRSPRWLMDLAAGPQLTPSHS
jgi:phosphatidylinositol alpha-1,6-mannosyltransferase